jgi:hypothetical protein
MLYRSLQQGHSYKIKVKTNSEFPSNTLLAVFLKRSPHEIAEDIIAVQYLFGFILFVLDKY